MGWMFPGHANSELLSKMHNLFGASHVRALKHQRSIRLASGSASSRARRLQEPPEDKDLAAASFATQDGKNAAEQIEARYKAIQASRDKLPRLLQIEALAQNPAVYQGKGGEWVQDTAASVKTHTGVRGPRPIMLCKANLKNKHLRSFRINCDECTV